MAEYNLYETQFTVRHARIAANASQADPRSEVHLRDELLVWKALSSQRKTCSYSPQSTSESCFWNVWSASVVQNGSDYLRRGLRVMSRPERFPDVPRGTWEKTRNLRQRVKCLVLKPGEKKTGWFFLKHLLLRQRTLLTKSLSWSCSGSSIVAPVKCLFKPQWSTVN